MNAFSIFIQYASVGLGEIYSERCLRAIVIIRKLPMLGKHNGPAGTICVKFHPITLGVEFVISRLGRKTGSENLKVDLTVLSVVTALDAVSVEQLGAFFHPRSRVATVAHNVEVSTLEEPLVEDVDIFEFQTIILQHPISRTSLSVACVPDEHCKNNERSI